MSSPVCLFLFFFVSCLCLSYMEWPCAPAPTTPWRTTTAVAACCDHQPDMFTYCLFADLDLTPTEGSCDSDKYFTIPRNNSDMVSAYKAEVATKRPASTAGVSINFQFNQTWHHRWASMELYPSPTTITQIVHFFLSSFTFFCLAFCTFSFIACSFLLPTASHFLFLFQIQFKITLKL